jgi:hypothetical protein
MRINTLALDANAKSNAMRQPPSKDDVLVVSSKYIPTKFVTLYIAIISSLPALKETGISPAITF